MTLLLVLALTCDIGFITLPEDSREFAHWSCPVVISQVGYEVTSATIDIAGWKKTGFEKRLLSMGGGLIFSIAVFKLLNIGKHYVTPREHRLNNSGIGCWGTSQFSMNIVRLILDKKHDKILVPTAIRIRTSGLREIGRDEKD